MKKIVSFVLLVFTISISFIACDKIDEGNFKKKIVGTTPTDTSTYVRKVFLEDYTGHTCVNCPTAAAKAKELKGDKLIIMALHVSVFAQPRSPDYTYDFRSTEGTALDNFFHISDQGLPQGMINRMGYPTNEHVKKYSEWGTYVSAIINNAPDANIKFTATYDTTLRKFSFSTKTKFLTALSGKFNLVVYAIEDSIVQAQEGPGNPPVLIPNYVHRHVLRGAVGGNAFGAQIKNGTATVGEEITNTYIYTLKPEWNAKHCALIAVLLNADTQEVIQAEEKSIQ
jgi:hypothetical protein